MKKSVLTCSLFLIPVFLISATFHFPAFCAEQDYPKKPIKLIAAYGPGGATDLGARILAGAIPEFLGQGVVVINHPGAAGSVGFNFVRKSEPDGYTMLMAAIGCNVLYPAMNPKLPFQYNDITNIARTQVNPGCLIVNAKSPWKTLEDLKTAIKNNPGKYKFGCTGGGNITHLGPILTIRALGFPPDAAVPVVYDSEGVSQLALIQGEIDFQQGNLAAYVSALQGGLVRGLAVTTPERIKGEVLEDIPTFAELGYPQVDLVGWRGISGPPGLPNHIVKTWEDAVYKTCQSKSWLTLVKKLGDEPGYMNSKDFNAYIDKQYSAFREVFTELGMLIK